jgi:membrane protease YdiL (CAAX protease family)
VNSPSGANRARRLTIAAFLAIVILDLIILQGVGLLLKPSGVDYGELPNGETLWRTITLPVALSVLLGVAVVSYLRWWKPVIHDDRPVQKWVRIVPILLVVSIVTTTGYSNLSDQSIGLVLALLVSMLLVGIGEELMFRGIGVVSFREAGFPEAKVALWTSVIFGAVHASNVFSEGPGAFGQALIVSLGGYFFYLTRRSAGTILLPMVLHGLYDFSIFSHAIGRGESDGGAQTGIPLLITIVLGIILLVRRKHIEPSATSVQ